MSFSSKAKSGTSCLTPLSADETAAGVISLPTLEDNAIYSVQGSQTHFNEKGKDETGHRVGAITLNKENCFKSNFHLVGLTNYFRPLLIIV